MKLMHWAILVNDRSNKRKLLQQLVQGERKDLLQIPKGAKGMVFSDVTLERFLEKEHRHGTRELQEDLPRSLHTLSSGEQKKALLRHIINKDPDFIVLDNPFDHLDIASQKQLGKQLIGLAQRIRFVQLASRKADVLPFIQKLAELNGDKLLPLNTIRPSIADNDPTQKYQSVPPPLEIDPVDTDILVDLRKVSVAFNGKTVLNTIEWTIGKGEFWELRGPNGSGKSTLLSMITGENPKGYGQELFLFGQKKGSGESIWDIKRRIGYFTPKMTDNFTGYHSAEQMVLSGFHDSVGLYSIPTMAEKRIAERWLRLIGMWSERDIPYHLLSTGQKRLLMCARAMIKHPSLLIFDEPTAGLDDYSAWLFVNLVQQFAKESTTAIVFVSHRHEPGLDPDHIYELFPGVSGSTGIAKEP